MNDQPSYLESLTYSFTIGLFLFCSTVSGAVFVDSEQLNALDENQFRLDNNAYSPTFSIEDYSEKIERTDVAENYKKILTLIQQNKLEEAENKLNELINKNPKEAEYYNLRALVEKKRRNIFASQENYEKSLELNPNNIVASLGLAKLFLDNNDLAKAQKYSEKALSIDEKSTYAYLILAEVAQKQKNENEIERILNLALDKAKGNIDQELLAIDSLFKHYLIKKQPEKALSITQQFKDRYPSNTKALSFYAKAQIANRQRSQAEKTFEKIISLDRSDIAHRFLLAQLLREKPENEQRVLELINDILKLDPKNLQAHVFKTSYLARISRFQDAENNAEFVEKTFPKLAVGKMLKANIYLAQNQPDKGLEFAQQAYKIQPNQKLLLKISQLFIAQGKIPEAIDFLNHESKKNPKNIAIHFTIANLYQNQNNYPQAENHYKTILGLMPNHVLSLNNLAWLYSNQNNPKALELAQKAYELSSGAPFIADTYGYVLVNQGQSKKGLEILQSAAKAAPSARIIQLHLAQALAANGEKNAAIRLLNPLVEEERFSNRKEAIELMNKLNTQ